MNIIVTIKQEQPGKKVLVKPSFIIDGCFVIVRAVVGVLNNIIAHSSLWPYHVVAIFTGHLIPAQVLFYFVIDAAHRGVEIVEVVGKLC
ncbi:hypothetical protein SDC9_152259 [bioreactor metagenome]|uniref:Uncharacterized protein n=1 Tax=bioreactor metagenome TaxID=1076179 RepID=A0A645EU92_9ZZZZ